MVFFRTLRRDGLLSELVSQKLIAHDCRLGIAFLDDITEGQVLDENAIAVLLQDEIRGLKGENEANVPGAAMKLNIARRLRDEPDLMGEVIRLYSDRVLLEIDKYPCFKAVRSLF